MASDEYYIPQVKEAQAFREISYDFGKPTEIFREAIANSLDAYATSIWLRVHVANTSGEEIVIINMSDNGIGLNSDTIKSFLNLSDSIKPDAAPAGMQPRRMTGYKGHGTKVYLNSRLLEILSYDNIHKPILCTVDDPRKELFKNRVPKAHIEELSVSRLADLRNSWGLENQTTSTGTAVRVHAYHSNDKIGLEHSSIRDYILWFTRWGSWEPKICDAKQIVRDDVVALGDCKLYLRGLGKQDQPNDDELLPFGHVFPSGDCTDLRILRAKDEIDPLKHYVRTWAFSDLPLLANPDKRIDFLFAIEGEGARREYNQMLRRQGRPRLPGSYLSEERYGLWLGKDFVAVQRFNEWVSEHSEYTRMHAFVNSQDLALTANRGSIENSDQTLISDIENTVKSVFENQIQPDSDYVKFRDEMEAIQRHRNASREGQDYKRRLKRLESKEVVEVDGREFMSPASEMDLIALVAGLQALRPELFPFVIRDYDSHFGYDGLATRNKALSISETKHLFVEFKLQLKTQFDHSFENLEAIICWTSRVRDGEQVEDLVGTQGKYSVSINANKTKDTYIVISNKLRNVEVIVLRDFLKARGIEFVST